MLLLRLFFPVFGGSLRFFSFPVLFVAVCGILLFLPSYFSSSTTTRRLPTSTGGPPLSFHSG